MNFHIPSNAEDPPPNRPVKTPRHWTRRLLRAASYALLTLATLVAAFYVIENWRGAWALKRYRAEAERQGGKFDYRLLIPPPVADAENFAATPFWKPMFDYVPGTHPVIWRDTNGWNHINRVSLHMRGAPASPPPGDWTMGERVNLAHWQSYYRGEYVNRTRQPGSHGAGGETARAREISPDDLFPTSTNPGLPAADVLLALTKYSAEMRELEVAALRPRSRFPIHYDEGPLTLLPHLGRLRALAMMFQLRAAASLALTNSAAARADLDTIFRLAEAPREEPFLISRIVRLTMYNQAIQVLWEGMNDHRWSDADLIEVQTRLGRINVEEEMVRVFGTERAFIALTTSQQVHRRAQILDAMKDLMPGSSISPMFPYYVRWAPAGWFYQTEVAFDRWLDDWRTAAERSRETGIYVEGPGIPAADNQVLHLLVTLFSTSRHTFPLTHLRLDLAQVACGLERYRLANGAYPETLGALVPRYLPSVPNDFMDGRPLRYRRGTAASMTLYSVGLNRIDDGGTFPVKDSSQSATTGDCVWRIK